MNEKNWETNLTYQTDSSSTGTTERAAKLVYSMVAVVAVAADPGGWEAVGASYFVVVVELAAEPHSFHTLPYYVDFVDEPPALYNDNNQTYPIISFINKNNNFFYYLIHLTMHVMSHLHLIIHVIVIVVMIVIVMSHLLKWR